MIKDCPERERTRGRGIGGGPHRGGGFGGGKSKRPTYGKLKCTNLGGESVRQNRDRYASDPISSRQSTF
jgi:hypothetical protein